MCVCLLHVNSDVCRSVNRVIPHHTLILHLGFSYLFGHMRNLCHQNVMNVFNEAYKI